jgi:hypothetical protein
MDLHSISPSVRGPGSEFAIGRAWLFVEGRGWFVVIVQSNETGVRIYSDGFILRTAHTVTQCKVSTSSLMDSEASTESHRGLYCCSCVLLCLVVCVVCVCVQKVCQLVRCMSVREVPLSLPQQLRLQLQLQLGNFFCLN